MVALIALMADFWIVSGTLAGHAPAGPCAVHVQGGRIVAIEASAPEGAETLDAKGLFLAPALIDAHVHLSVAGELAKVAEAERKAGIAAVLDLGEPERLLAQLPGLRPLRVLFAGPLLTAPKGYPTQSWGKDGYGGELATVADARAAVERLAKAGASMVKLAFDARFPLLDPKVAKAVAEAAHARGLKVAAHALDVKMVRRALDAAVDVLAHTPVEPLPPELVREIGARKLHVVSTLKSSGGAKAAIANLGKLAAAGAVVVYGTDLGNQFTAPGVDADELGLLAQAGLSPAAILRSATSEPASLLGLRDLGAIEVGKAASLLALPSDPALDATALALPAWVLIDGVRQ